MVWIDFIPVLGYLDDIILLPALVALTIKSIPDDVFERYRKEAEGMGQDGKPKRRYFALRTENSKWSEKNKALVEQLEQRGMMIDYGRDKIAEAKKNGQWDAPKNPEVGEEEIGTVTELLKGQEPAYTNFLAMSPSVKKTYTRAYMDAKTEEGQKNYTLNFFR